jgi:hypothetical protein
MLVERPRATQMRLSYGLAEPAPIRDGVRRLARVIRSLQSQAPQRRSLPIT